MMNAARRSPAARSTRARSPRCVSAIVKAYLTEGMRAVVNDAMDIRAGAAIQRGPRNLAGAHVTAVPIGITVEGANILTRSMIIYGQGAIRCHPFVQHEISAIADNDLATFDKALFGHVNLLYRATSRARRCSRWTGSRLAAAPRTEVRRATTSTSPRFTASFALVSDVAMGTLGGTLKRREKITGRLADALAYMYLASAALKRYHDEGKTTANYNLVRWSAEHCLYRMQEALLGVLENLPVRAAACCVVVGDLSARPALPAAVGPARRARRARHPRRPRSAHQSRPRTSSCRRRPKSAWARWKPRWTRPCARFPSKRNCAMRCVPANSAARPAICSTTWAARRA